MVTVPLPPLFFPIIYLLRKLGHLSYGIFYILDLLYFFIPLPNFLLSCWCFSMFLETPYLLGTCDICCKYLCPVCHFFYFLYISCCCENVYYISIFSTLSSHFCTSQFMCLHFFLLVFIPLNSVYTSIIFQIRMICFDSQPWKMRNSTYALILFPYQLCKLHHFYGVHVCNIYIFFCDHHPHLL